MEQLWERSEEGRKETNREPSTRTWKESARDRAGEKGETGEARAETGTGKATVRQNREEKERKKQRLSSEMLKRKQTKESGSQAPAPEEKSERGSPVEQLRERSRDGRKETNRKPSTGTGKESMRDQAGKNGESKEAKAERQHRGSH